MARTGKLRMFAQHHAEKADGRRLGDSHRPLARRLRSAGHQIEAKFCRWHGLLQCLRQVEQGIRTEQRNVVRRFIQAP